MRNYWFLLLFILFFSCKTDGDKKASLPIKSETRKIDSRQSFIGIEERLGQLFVDIQLGEVFEDSKTFVDCTAKYPYDSIIINYERQKNLPNFHLESFVLANFDVPPSISSDFKSDPKRTASEHVEVLWPVLERKSDSIKEGSTLIPLPESYIVPGGRFREVYYWDSYFTMLGLVESGRLDIIEDMLDNFSHLIEEVGHIPNGNRTYYITRSQPPFFSQMVKLMAEQKGDIVYKKYREALRKEYEFWMKGNKTNENASYHCVKTSEGIVNRYYDLGNTPRQESYREDYLQVQDTDGGEKMYRDLRSGAESGWDYSTRWFADALTIETIETIDIIPVDLNALLFGLEEVLLKCYPNDKDFSERVTSSMQSRKQFLDVSCWNATDGVYEDYNWKKKKQTKVKSLAMAYPLFFKMASQEQADAVAAYLKKHFLKPGGVTTTLNHSGQQWDAPNGWAPLQWITIQGLENYGHSGLAKTIAERWVAVNERVYANTGKFVEKYNVEDMTLKAGGGEYPVQDGFGWSNGVYLALKAYLAEK